MSKTSEKMAEAVRKARETGDVNIMIDAIPYAKLLGIKGVEGKKDTFHLEPRKTNIGNPTLPALHGGAVGGFMELSASTYLMMEMDVFKVPKTVDFSIDFLRPGRFKDLYSRCVIQRFGSKLVNISIEAWQDDETESVAKARAQFLVE